MFYIFLKIILANDCYMIADNVYLKNKTLSRKV